MKRRAVVLIIICIVGLCLHFSRLICTTDAQILLYIAKEKGIESVDGLTLSDIIISDDKTNALVICELYRTNKQVSRGSSAATLACA